MPKFSHAPKFCGAKFGRTKEQGVSLYLSVIIMSILLAIVLGMSTILFGQIRIIRGMENSVIAFYAADTGIERVLYEDRMCRKDGCISLSWDCVDTANCDSGRLGGNISDVVGAASYQVNFDDGATVIKAVGIYKGTRRAIEVIK